MADILTTIKLQADQYLAEGKKVEELMRGISTEEKKTSAELKQASAQRAALLKQEEALLISLGKARKGATSLESLKAYDKQIATTTANIKTLGGATNDIAKKNDAFGSSFAKLGGVIAAAFSVQQIIAFGKESIAAFAKAEKAQLQLLNALGGNTAAQGRLIDQAKELQSALGIDDDTIVSQQAFLALQGRTESQIAKTIQAAIQLSAVTGEDLPSAVQKLDATFEGNIGRLGKLDSRFGDLSSTELANGAAIDLINEKYKGFAESGAASVAGQLEIEKRKVEELTETIGGILAPAWIGAKKAALEYITAQLQAFGIGESDSEKQIERSKKAIVALTEKQFAEKSLAEISAEIGKLSLEIQTRQGKVEIALLQTRIDTLRDLREKNISSIKDAGKSEIETLANLKKQKEDLEKKQEKVTAGPQADALIKQIADVQKKIDEITGKAAEERRKVAKDAADQAAKDAEDAFKRQQDANKKSADDTLQIQLANLETSKQAELAIEDTSVQEKLLIDRKYLLQRALLFEDDKVEQAKIASQIAEIDGKLGEQKIKDASDTSDAVTKQNKDAYDADVKNQAEAEKRKQENIQATFEAAQNLIGQLMGLLSAQSQSEIESINSRKDAELSAIDEQLAALDEAHENRKIGDKQYEASKKKLLEQRKADEKKAAEQTKKLKQEEAEREKAYTIFSIILSTARAIIAALATVPPNPFLATLAGITGAAELAIAVATPIPEFAKGTKGKKEKGMGLVGEKGAEFMFMPQGTKVVPHTQTKKHSRAVDAMIDDRFEDYVYYDFVLPALQAAQKKKEQASSKTFAENMRDSFSSPQSGLSFYDLVDGLAKNNKPAAEALGAAIAKHLNSGYSNNRYR